MYESHKQPLLARGKFVTRVMRHLLAACGVLAISLGIGIAGYMATERLALTDAFLNASMLLGGMGPVNAPQTPTGKIFAGVFALYAGLVFIVMAALLFTPVLHRLLHRMHVDDPR